MLTNLLAWSLAIASLGLYLSGFFLPELYRKFDLVASGAGLFFALTLWIYGDRVNGGLLLGTSAGVLLILWFGWQTFQYRWQLTHPSDRTDTQKAQALWQRLQTLLPEGTLTRVKDRLQALLSRPNPPTTLPPAAPPTPATPPMDTSPTMQEDLWSDAQGSGSPAAPSDVSAPPITHEPEKTQEPEAAETPEIAAASAEEAPESVESIGATEEPTASTAPETPEIAAASAEEAPESVESTGVTEEPTTSTAPETPAAAPEPAPASPTHIEPEDVPASAADLIGDIPENSDDDSSTGTIENPKHSPPTPEQINGDSEEEDWPPPGTSIS
ncbi:Ycf66 family protein [Thermosynechococcaceae cyanobacterium Okahandja]